MSENVSAIGGNDEQQNSRPGVWYCFLPIYDLLAMTANSLNF